MIRSQRPDEECRICGGMAVLAFRALVLSKHQVSYFSCPICGFHQTEKPYWLNEAYERPINLSDTGLISRNTLFSQKVSVILYFLFGQRSQYLDYGGGYGLFTRMMRDIGFDYFWYDSLTENIFAQGFSKEEAKEEFQAVTAIEVFEHFPDPGPEIRKLLEISKNVVLTTELIDSSHPPPRDWWYYGFDHGQHVAFYSLQTMHYLARVHDLHFYTDRHRFHMFSEKPISQALFGFLAAGSRHGIFEYVKRRMKSKTVDDSLRLLALGVKNK